VKIKETLDTK